MLAATCSNVTGNTTGDIWSRTTRPMLVSIALVPQIVK